MNRNLKRLKKDLRKLNVKHNYGFGAPHNKPDQLYHIAYNSITLKKDADDQDSTSLLTLQGSTFNCWFHSALNSCLNGVHLSYLILEKIIKYLLTNNICYLNPNFCYNNNTYNLFYDLFYTLLVFKDKRHTIQLDSEKLRKTLKLKSILNLGLGGYPFQTLYKILNTFGITYTTVPYGSNNLMGINTDIIIIKQNSGISFKTKDTLPTIIGEDYILDSCVFRKSTSMLTAHFFLGYFNSNRKPIIDWREGTTINFDWREFNLLPKSHNWYDVKYTYIIYVKSARITNKVILYTKILRFKYGLYFIRLYEKYNPLKTVSINTDIGIIYLEPSFKLSYLNNDRNLKHECYLLNNLSYIKNIVVNEKLN